MTRPILAVLVLAISIPPLYAQNTTLQTDRSGYTTGIDGNRTVNTYTDRYGNTWHLGALRQASLSDDIRGGFLKCTEPGRKAPPKRGAGTQFSALGSHWRFLACVLKTRKDADSIRPISPAGAYRFAPDPI